MTQSTKKAADMDNSNYAIIGVLQQHESPDEWVYVHDFGSGSLAHAQMEAINKAFARQTRSADRKNKGYPKPFRNEASYPTEMASQGWHLWHIATVELADGLPTTPGDYAFVEDIDHLRDNFGGDRDTSGDLVPYLYVAAGQAGGGDSWAQRLRQFEAKYVPQNIEDWADGDPRNNWDGLDWAVDGTYGIVEQVTPGHYRVYDGEANLIEETTVAPGAGALDPDDIDTINRHRRRIGGEPLDVSAGWSSSELQDMADNIRKTGRTNNPDQAELKRKLLR